jgi:hypothetical protein
MTTRNPVPASFGARVDLVRQYGGTTTEQHGFLENRVHEFYDLGHRALDRLRELLVDPKASVDDIALWRTLAVAEAGQDRSSQAEVNNAVRAFLDGGLWAQYAAVAGENFATIAAAFDDVATRLTDAHKVISPAVDPASLISAPEQTRTAWQEGQTLLHEVDALLTPLATAAELAGHPADSDEAQIGLVVDASGLHRRRVWEAWQSDDRWVSLLDLGATLRAATLDEFTHYAMPQPIQVTHERGERGYRRVELDPEDEAVSA